MIVHDVQQGSQAWLDLHVGICTASRFHRLMTEKTRKASKGEAVQKLACELAAEWMTGGAIDSATTQFMQRGLKLEQQAIAWYAFDRGMDVTPVGFITTDDGSAGCSPDGLIGDDATLEIKCPAPANHVGNLCDPDGFRDQYYAQCQGCLWICERQWSDLVSYHPTIPPVVVRIERDENYINVLSEAVASVNAMVNAILVRHGFKESPQLV